MKLGFQFGSRYWARNAVIIKFGFRNNCRRGAVIAFHSWYRLQGHWSPPLIVGVAHYWYKVVVASTLWYVTLLGGPLILHRLSNEIGSDADRKSYKHITVDSLFLSLSFYISNNSS